MFQAGIFSNLLSVCLTWKKSCNKSACPFVFNNDSIKSWLKGPYAPWSGLDDWELAGQQQQEKLSFSVMHLLIGLLFSVSVLAKTTELDRSEIHSLYLWQKRAHYSWLDTRMCDHITTPEGLLRLARRGSLCWFTLFQSVQLKDS